MNEARVYADGFERSFAEVKDLPIIFSPSISPHLMHIFYRRLTLYEISRME